ncbi:MAG: ribosome biogenesis GTPase Der [Nitrospinaceae bacterium]
MPVPVVAIIGRANVGKSTLFNKLTRKRTAIVNDTPGVTRDRMYGRTEWSGKPVIVVDTGGIDFEGKTDLEHQVQEQARLAQDEADAIIFVVDHQRGVTPQDREVIGQVRKSGKPLFLAVNKVDHPRHENGVYEFAQLGVERVYPISAEHSLGLGGLTQDIAGGFPETEHPEKAPDAIHVAIVGKPNAGKSSLVNRILKSERCVVSEVPGTTRDAVDSHLVYQGKNFVLIDTAGIRRKGRTRKLLDKFSVIMALKALDRCDIAVLVLDGTTGITEQDATIAGYAFERGKGCVIVATKWDLVKERSRGAFEELAREKLRFLEFAPILTVSGKTGQGLNKLLSHIGRVYEEYSRRIPTRRLNDCFERAIRKNPMSSYRGKFLKMFYTTQVKNCPPTFRCFVNYPQGIHFSYRRYLTNSLRKDFGFSGTPVRLLFSSRDKGD